LAAAAAACAIKNTDVWKLHTGCLSNPSSLHDFMCMQVACGSSGSLRLLELSVKFPAKVYEQLAASLASNSSLEVLSLAGSCCGDAALAVSVKGL
jgi:hypothetical protein